MKRQLFIGLIIFNWGLTIYAQNWSGSTPGSIYYNQGNVGIGTSSPLGKLDIFSSTANDVLLSFPRSSNSTVKACWFSVDGNDNSVFTTTNAHINFKTNWNGGTPLTTLFLKSDGNVGIGTATPQTLLHIYGVNSGLLRLENYTDDNIGIQLKGTSGQRWIIGNNISMGGTGQNFQIYDWANSAVRLNIDSNGNVEIGMTPTSTVAKLETAGGIVVYSSAISNAPTASSLVLDQQSGGVARVMASGASTWNANLAINPYGGNVGIGTTSPSCKLQVGDATGQVTLGIFGKSTTADVAPMLAFVRSNAWYMGMPSAAGFSLGYNIASYSDADILAGSKFYITSSGNVGIGTTSPGVKLDVNGDMGIKGSNKIYLADDLGTPPYIKGIWDSNDYTGMEFHSGFSGLDTTVIVISANARVGIGTKTPQNLLDVYGTIHAKEFKASLDGWSDYVFDKDYKLLSLNDVENYINTNKKLPDIPSAKEITTDGVKLGEMNALLLKKVEELTLYVIEQNKKIQSLDKKIEKLESEKTNKF